MTTYYISGPMRTKPQYNRAQFLEVEEALIQFLYYGEQDISDRIINPTRNFNGDQSLEPNDYMAVDLKQVLEADVLVLLPDWETSEGARREVQLAIWTGKEFIKAIDAGLDWQFISADIASPETQASIRAQACDKAKGLITGDRNNKYGPPWQDFQRTADAMTAYGYRHTQLPASAPVCPACGARPMQSHDTAIAVDCVKTSRIMWSPDKEDHWIDKIGYASCGYECAVQDAKKRQAVLCGR